MSNVTFISGLDDVPGKGYTPPIGIQPIPDTADEKELPSLLLPMAVLTAGFFAWEFLT